MTLKKGFNTFCLFCFRGSDAYITKSSTDVLRLFGVISLIRFTQNYVYGKLVEI